MIKLLFKNFLEELKKEKLSANPTLHYLETEIEFKIFFKNYEFWEYYAVVKKEKIIEFGNLNNTNETESINDFKTEYLYHAVELEPLEVEELLSIGTIDKKNKTKNPYANSTMEIAMLEKINESKDKLIEALNVL